MGRMTDYHTALKSGYVYRGQPVARWSGDGCVAMVHDITTGPLPPEFDSCDVLYADPPWPAGMAEFNRRAVKDCQYGAMVDSVGLIIRQAKVPVVLVVGKRFPIWPPALQKEISHNGGTAHLMVYNQALNIPAGDSMGILDWLAHTFNRVGDFMAGYGRTGSVFKRAGKTFVMSDYNPRCVGFIAANAWRWR